MNNLLNQIDKTAKNLEKKTILDHIRKTSEVLRCRLLLRKMVRLVDTFWNVVCTFLTLFESVVIRLEVLQFFSKLTKDSWRRGFKKTGGSRKKTYRSGPNGLALV